jgi:rhodanese-related sulfurtransferase
MRILLVLLVLWAAWDLAIVPLLGVRQVLPWRLAAMIASGQRPLLVDVRTPPEFRLFHLPGSMNLPYPLDPADLPALADQDRAQPVVVICMTGHRSPLAARSLKQAGFADAANLTWGASVYALLGGDVVSGKD